MLPCDVKVPQCGLELAMAHQTLDGVEIHPGFSEMGRARVTQEMQPPGLGNPGTLFCALENQVRRFEGERLGAIPAGKEPGSRTIDAPIRP
jgi:hypothetical protein